MKRSTLRTFVHRAVAAALPLAAVPGCVAPAPAKRSPDLAVPARDLDADPDMAAPSSPADLYASSSARDLYVAAGDADLFATDDMPVGDNCGASYNIALAGGLDGSCFHYCRLGFICSYGAIPDAGDVVTCRIDCAGRRPATLLPASQHHGGDEMGELFARMAYLEDASVHAFRTLGDELLAHGAPARLVDAAQRAAADEVRHARVTARIANRFGASSEPAKVMPAATRSIEALAVENMAEGCVREGYGALVASYQARTAGDHAVRLALAVISVDETSHAALAWDVAAWARDRLDDAARARVEEARRDALAELAADIEHEPSPSLVALAGLPSRAPARALLSALAADSQRRAA